MTISEGRYSIAPGGVHAARVEVDVSMELSVRVEVQLGPKIDIHFLDDQDYRDYNAGKGLRRYSELSQSGAKYFEKTVTVPAGIYHLLLQNNSGRSFVPFTGSDSTVAYKIY